MGPPSFYVIVFYGNSDRNTNISPDASCSFSSSRVILSTWNLFFDGRLRLNRSESLIPELLVFEPVFLLVVIVGLGRSATLIAVLLPEQSPLITGLGRSATLIAVLLTEQSPLITGLGRSATLMAVLLPEQLSLVPGLGISATLIPALPH